MLTDIILEGGILSSAIKVIFFVFKNVFLTGQYGKNVYGLVDELSKFNFPNCWMFLQSSIVLKYKNNKMDGMVANDTTLYQRPNDIYVNNCRSQYVFQLIFHYTHK